MRCALAAVDDDQQLLTLVADGDRVALGELFDRYGPTLLAIAQQILGESAEAEELLQDLFLEVWRRAPAWRPGQPRALSTWLVLRMRHHALTLLGRSPGLGPHGQQPGFLPDGVRARGRFDTLSMDDPTLGRQRSQMQYALGSLSSVSRRVLDLCFFEGLKRSEVARRLGLTPKAVAKHLHQVLELMESTSYTLWS